MESIVYPFLYEVLFINRTIEWIVVSFRFDVQFITFSFENFLYSKFFLTSFLQLFFIKTSSNWLTIDVTSYVCPRNCIFNFTNNKNLFWPILAVSFTKKVFLFWNLNMITNFEFRSGYIRILIAFNVRFGCFYELCYCIYQQYLLTHRNKHSLKQLSCA